MKCSLACVVMTLILWESSPGYCCQQPTEDSPLARAFRGELKPTVEVLLDFYRTKRKYKNSRFPMKPQEFTAFKNEMKTELARTLGLALHHRTSQDQLPSIANPFEDRLLETKVIHGIKVELHAVTIQPTGLVVPMALCLPSHDRSSPCPAVCVFSGHTTHGLQDLVENLDSYQQGIAIRLAQAGIASIAVEKIDTGYLSRNGTAGNDEAAIASLMLSWGSVLRSHQLRACLAATEILARHDQVDAKRIGATGVSLGGWLAVQTAMLSDRIKAVADFGRKTRSIPENLDPLQYKGQSDPCHIIPGMLRLSDRNLMTVVLAPMPMLAGHGRRDLGSHGEHVINFRTVCESQYEALHATQDYTYLIHDGGDVMPSKEVVAWFLKEFTASVR